MYRNPNRDARRIRRLNLGACSRVTMERFQNPDFLPENVKPYKPTQPRSAKQTRTEGFFRRVDVRRNRQNVRRNLRSLPTCSVEGALRNADLLDSLSKDNVEYVPRVPRLETDPCYELRCAACKGYHPTDEHQISYDPYADFDDSSQRDESDIDHWDDDELFGDPDYWQQYPDWELDWAV